MDKARKAALEALMRVENGAYAGLTVDGLLNKGSFCTQDRDFVTRCVYGVLERKITLDYILAHYTKKLHPQVRNILRLGLYQILYMQVDDFAAVDESVKLVKAYAPKAAGLTNAVLRRFIREGKKVNCPEDRLDLLYSCSDWIVQDLCDGYGIEKTVAFLKDSLETPPLYLRVNTKKGTQTQLINTLANQGVAAISVSELSNALCVTRGNPIQTQAFSQGLFHVQDLSSQLCGQLVASFCPNTVLDLCGAPGGKSFTIAQEIGENASVLCCDLHPHRVSLIEQGINRLTLPNMKAMEHDALQNDGKFGQFDLVLCDVPCSGIGVIRRKPELKYKKQEEIAGLPALQRNILDCAAQYVKPGGICVYATCTLLPQENQEVVQWFIKQHNDFLLAELAGYHKAMLPIFPAMFGGDGFFIAAFRKEGAPG